MRNTLILTIIVFSIFLYSCENGRITELENTVSDLTKLNSKLIDSIQTLQEKNISSFYLIENLEKENIKVNETSKIHFDFGYKNYVPEYNVYRIYGENYAERELILKNQKLSEFDFEFTPENIGEDRIQLEVAMNIDGIEWIIPADLRINVID
ncbi:hypothetical protein [Altibacter lentus]|uniref:hypothetical protein n=1 Tax=Altibacter lentus TaxID=1223410 RepID=UPI000556B594|nr:hypothetical protein [Altibacter lentus]